MSPGVRLINLVNDDMEKLGIGNMCLKTGRDGVALLKNVTAKATPFLCFSTMPQKYISNITYVNKVNYKLRPSLFLSQVILTDT